MQGSKPCALPLGDNPIIIKGKSTRRDSNPRPSPWQGDALPLSHSCTYENIKRVMGIEPTSSAWKADVLPLNHTRISKCPETESNRRHEDFQSSALPTELSGQSIYLLTQCHLVTTKYIIKHKFLNVNTFLKIFQKFKKILNFLNKQQKNNLTKQQKFKKLYILQNI